jgi:ribosomal protein S18 acetylase RimI-like enzyme
MLKLRVLGRYFRARHIAPLPGPPAVPAGFRLTGVDAARDLPDVVRLMNMAYPSLPDFVDLRDVEEMIGAPYYFPDGWFLLREETHGHPIGLAVNGYCSDSDEGFIDWIQVLPRYRRRSLGSLLVTESIRRLAAASFITVSGSLDAPFAVGDLYSKCGFGQTRQWTILGRPSRARPGPAATRQPARPPAAP